jgi:transposase
LIRLPQLRNNKLNRRSKITKLKKYSKEFKLDAITLVIEQNYSQVEASRNLGINPNMLGRWIKEAENDDG